jgi:MFS family permease
MSADQTPEVAIASSGSPRAASTVGFLYWTVALYATSLGASPATVGVILGSYSVLALVLSIPAGIITERVGSGKMMFGGCFLGAAALLLIVYGRGLGMLTAGLAILGVSQVMVSIGTQVETIVGAAPRDMARAITLYFFFSSGSQIAGPVVGALLVHGTDYPSAFLGAAALSLTAMLAAGGPARRPAVRDAVMARPPAFETITSTLGEKPAARVALIVSLTAELVMAFWTTFFPLHLTRRGYGSEAVAFFFGLRAVSNSGVRLLMGRITERLSRTRALMTGLLVTAVSLVAMALLGSNVGIGLAVLVFGFAMGLYTTLAAIAVASGFPPEAAGLGVGMRILASRVGLIVGPVLTGLLVQAFGYVPAFVATALICAGPALLYLRRPKLSEVRASRKRAAVPPGDSQGR